MRHFISKHPYPNRLVVDWNTAIWTSRNQTSCPDRNLYTISASAHNKKTKFLHCSSIITLSHRLQRYQQKRILYINGFLHCIVHSMAQLNMQVTGSHLPFPLSGDTCLILNFQIWKLPVCMTPKQVPGKEPHNNICNMAITTWIHHQSTGTLGTKPSL